MENGQIGSSAILVTQQEIDEGVAVYVIFFPPPNSGMVTCLLKLADIAHVQTRTHTHTHSQTARTHTFIHHQNKRMHVTHTGACVTHCHGDGIFGPPTGPGKIVSRPMCVRVCDS